MLGPTLPLVLVALPVLVATCVVLVGLVSRLQRAPEPIPAARVVVTSRARTALPFDDDAATVVFSRPIHV